MDRNDEFLKNLQNMDQASLKKVLKKAIGNLSNDQQKQIKNIASDKAKLEQMKSKIRPEDIEGLKKNLGSAEQLKAYLQRADIQKRIGEIL